MEITEPRCRRGRSSRNLLLLAVVALAIRAVAGELTDRSTLTLARILRGTAPAYRVDFVLADAVPRHERRFTEFSGDVSGRYIEALSVIARTTGRDFPELHQVVRQLLPLQRPDGHFGDPLSVTNIQNRDMAILWGNGRLLVGLTAYHELTQNADTLATARRLGDFLVSMAPKLNQDDVQATFSKGRSYLGYICWTQCLEGLARLNRVTGDDRYRKVAGAIAARTARSPSQHSHGFVTSLRGILDLYQQTGEARYLEQAESEWQGIVDSGNLLPQGALPECFAPGIVRDEGCSEADWLRFSLGLWQTTGKTKYLEAAEQCWFNEFSFNQFSTGDFGHNTLTPHGAGMPSAQAWWCCTLHGLRAFPDVSNGAFTKTTDGVSYDLPVDGSVTTAGLSVEADSRLGKDGSVAIRVIKSDAEARELAVRVPPWAADLKVEVNGTRLESTPAAGRFHFKRAWKTGDRLQLHYTLKTRLIHSHTNPMQVGFFVGPWMLGASHERESGFCNEPGEKNRVILSEIANEQEILEPAMAGESGKLQASYAHRRLRFEHKGYPMQPAWLTLRPIAERTAGGTQDSWTFWFTPKEKAP